MWIIVDSLGWIVLAGLLAGAGWTGWRLYQEVQPLSHDIPGAQPATRDEWSGGEQPTYQ